MNSAIHKKTGKEYFAPLIWKQGLFENKDVHDEEWFAPSDEIENYYELENKEIKVTPVISHMRKNAFIPSFFRLLPEFSEKVILVKESELHKKLKMVISVLLTEEFNCSLKYDKETYSIKTLPIDFDRLKENIKKMEVRKNITTTEEYRTADVLLPFIFNPFWGNGIAIEIRVSEKEDTEEDKENFWFQRGYSLIWIDEEDFIIDEGRLGLRKNVIGVVPFSIGYKRILDNHINEMQSYLHEGWEKLEEEKKEFSFLTERIGRSCRTCKHGSVDKLAFNNELVACWLHTRVTRNGKNAPTRHEQLDSCGDYENS